MLRDQGVGSVAWVLLGGAIVAEVVATMGLRAAAEAPRPWAVAVIAAGYVTAFALFAQALRTLDVGPAYAVWAGVGTVGAAVGGWLLFGERFGPTVMVGIGLVLAGVMVITLAGGVTHA